MARPTHIRMALAALPLALILGACGSAATAASPTASAAASAHAKHAKHGAHKRPGAVGVVTAVNATSLTLRKRNGLTSSFVLTANTKIRTAKGAAATTLAAGERVRVLLASGSTSLAKAVVILPPAPVASPSG